MFHVEHSERFDVVVVGGGHAGTEAALAARRRGAHVALVSHDPRAIGVLSCNPSIGGVGKGHLVRELDALDGAMARAADAAAIHHRMLNRSKGAAVHGPRVQADRKLYRRAVQTIVHEQDVIVVSGEVVDIDFSRGADLRAILADGSMLVARAIVLATGTFLGGRIFRGKEREAGGRIDERAATRLASRLREAEFPVRRLKTGTPPRLDGRTIDWSKLALQRSDQETWHMSPATTAERLPQVSCAITRTSGRTHDIIRASLPDSPMFAGAIEGRGPRYCPSIEDKVARFGDRDGHQIFLEPEGLDDANVYPNGISTSLSCAAQDAMVASIDGLEDARISAYGYAVEYDYFDPRNLNHQLGSRDRPGLFCAGQINGTTGYEEAGAQGVIAGANAAAFALDLEPIVIDRADGYIGVMIDDLVLQGVAEPYRMLTARAEYRLSLRSDNAEARLSDKAGQHGLLSDERRKLCDRRNVFREQARAGNIVECPTDIIAEIQENERYAPYLLRQRAEIEQMRREGSVALTCDEGSLRKIAGLSNEMIERLTMARPVTLDQASRVGGVTPAALTALWLHAKRAS